MARTKPMIRTRYFATQAITVNGVEYRDGDEILNARSCNLEAMLRRGQATTTDWEATIPGGTPPIESAPEPDVQPVRPEPILAETVKTKLAKKPSVDPKLKRTSLTEE